MLPFGTEGGGGGLFCSEAGSNGEALCVGVKAVGRAMAKHCDR